MAAVGDARKRAAEKASESADVEALIQLWLTLGWSLRGETARENTAALFLSSDWLAAHTAAAREKAWDEGYEIHKPRPDTNPTANPYRTEAQS